MLSPLENNSIAIIGAGPAGLAAANALRNCGFNLTIFEAGKSLLERDHNICSDLATGVGGVGLFSDGKFSYYPSGTNLYKITDYKKLKEAYNWLSFHLLACGIEEGPSLEKIFQQIKIVDFAQGLKNYPSYYTSLPQRKQLINRLYQPIKNQVFTETRITKIISVERGYLIEFVIHTQKKQQFFTAIILANGRFGSLDLLTKNICPKLPKTFLRTEVGIRIESHHSLGFLTRNKACDVKRIWEEDGIEFRTFCTCRRGEIWNINYGGISALSGRSDGRVTDYSNFGFLVRFKNKKSELVNSIFNKIQFNLFNNHQAAWEPLGSFLEDPFLGKNGNFSVSSRPWFPHSTFNRKQIGQLLGEELYAIVKTGVRKLLLWSPDLVDRQTICLFPAIEGTGYYPDTDGNLKVKEHNIWCAGDVVGKFRGLVPALLSGYYTGLNAASYLLSDEVEMKAYKSKQN